MVIIIFVKGKWSSIYCGATTTYRFFCDSGMCSRLEFSATTRLFAVIARPLLRQYVSSSCAHHSRPPIEVKLVRRARLREVMKPGSGAMRVAVDCSVDRVYKMSEKVHLCMFSISGSTGVVSPSTLHVHATFNYVSGQSFPVYTLLPNMCVISVITSNSVGITGAQEIGQTDTVHVLFDLQLATPSTPPHSDWVRVWR